MTDLVRILSILTIVTTIQNNSMVLARNRRPRTRAPHTRQPRPGASAVTPTLSPVSTYTNLPPFPLGPYITQANSSQVVTLPDPPTPDMSSSSPDTRTNCPHLQSGLLDWHAVTTWTGLEVPGSGKNVTLPNNSKVVITSSVTEQLAYIIVPPSSQLIVGESTNGITLDVSGMDVQGSLIAGSATCRILTPITITLHGQRPSDAVTNPSYVAYKGIAVMGLLSLHGKRYFRTWSRLAKTVNPGDSVIMLQHPVNWEAGQQIVLVTTAMKDSKEWHQNEILTVSAIHPSPPADVGAIVYITSSAKYKHIANSAYQAEVGLLSRKIVIQGSSDDSEPTDPDPLNCNDRKVYGSTAQPCPNTALTGFGGHMVVYYGGIGNVEGVELFRMGQTNVLGRYPMHFHLLGECPSCYFRDSSIHRSYYRCISVHGTNSSLVSENVAYDVTGYCYYLEDGVESNNTISFNLAALINNIGPPNPWGNGQTTNVYQQSSTLTNPADVTASGYYITNVHNNLIGNAASGVSGEFGMYAAATTCCFETVWLMHSLFVFLHLTSRMIGMVWLCISQSPDGPANVPHTCLSAVKRHFAYFGWQHGTLDWLVVAPCGCFLLRRRNLLQQQQRP